jgi:hypothetical protein
MATRAKYQRVQAPKEVEEKKDTDILMRFSEKYGIVSTTQENTFPADSLFSLERTRKQLPSKQQRN